MEGLALLFSDARRDVGAVVSVAEADHKGDPVDDDGGFAAAGAGKDEEGAVYLEDRLPLFGVDMGKAFFQRLLAKLQKIIMCHEIGVPFCLLPGRLISAAAVIFRLQLFYHIWG